MVAVPMAYQVMLELPDLERYDTSSLLVCGTGTAPCPPSLGREIQKRFQVRPLYRLRHDRGCRGDRLQQSGRFRHPTGRNRRPADAGVDIRIVDDQRRDLPQDRWERLAMSL